jgi:S-DNA-T family DNA segregation ATPase FtsK/SpoIIIE
MLDAASGGKLMRLHGAYITNDEISRVVAHIKAQCPAQYSDLGSASVDATADGSDPLYQEILQYLDGIDEVSISLLQRRFRIGYNRSARIIDTLECEGHIAPGGTGKTRKVVRPR